MAVLTAVSGAGFGQQSFALARDGKPIAVVMTKDETGAGSGIGEFRAE